MQKGVGVAVIMGEHSGYVYCSCNNGGAGYIC